MSFLSEIKEIRHNHILYSVLSFLGAIGPGFLIIYNYRHADFAQVDVFKLIILSASLTLPVILANYIIVSTLDKRLNSAVSMAMGAFGTSAVLYIALLGAYLLKLSFPSFVVGACAIEAIFVSIAFIGGRGNTPKP